MDVAFPSLKLCHCTPLARCNLSEKIIMQKSLNYKIYRYWMSLKYKLRILRKNKTVVIKNIRN